MISLKSKREIDIMTQAGSIVALAHKAAAEALRPGITTRQIDEVIEKVILTENATPSFKGYHGFPAASCISINDEVVHGIPGNRKIEDGDLVSIDIGVYYEGYHGDSAKSHLVGNGSDNARRLVDVTRESFYEGLKFCKEGYRLYDVSNAIQTYVETRGYSVVKDLVGHGIGRELHEDPQIPNYGPKGKGPRLKAGMTLAIEPMINIGTDRVAVLDDDWTVVTMDKSLSAHYEHTVLITDDEPVLLTALKEV